MIIFLVVLELDLDCGLLSLERFEIVGLVWFSRRSFFEFGRKLIHFLMIFIEYFFYRRILF